MSSKCYTWKEIVEAKDTGGQLTKTQSAKAAYMAILKKYVVVKPEFEFYHKAKGVWQQKLPKVEKKTVEKEKVAVKKPEPIVNENEPTRNIRVYSKEDVKKINDDNIIGFVPIYKTFIS